jgi:hypothetical protein
MIQFEVRIFLRDPTECLPLSPEDGNISSFRNVVFLYTEILRMNKAQKSSASEWYTALSDPFSFLLSQEIAHATTRGELHALL